MNHQVLIEVSARHVHLTAEAVEILFGVGAQLEPRNNLTQPGLFASKQHVNVVGPKGTLNNLTILGPVRKYTQIELAKTDARVLGINAPTRMSGDLEGTPGCTLVGPAGSLEIKEGVIVAQRHIHVGGEDAEKWGLASGDVVSVAVEEEPGRSLVFRDVQVRLKPRGISFVHIDTDEGNAAGIQKKAYGVLSIAGKEEMCE